MAKKEDKISIIYVIIFIIIALILSNFILEDREDATITAHGVRICDKNYDCGEADNICPEDYGAQCVIKDPDCG